MYRPTMPSKTSIKVNTAYIADNLETKIMKIMTSKEPITDTAPLIYTERKEGVQPAYDIRSDRMEIALDALDYVSRSHIAKRESTPSLGEQAQEGMKAEGGENAK